MVKLTPTKRRKLTQEEKEAAARAKAIWLKFKKEWKSRNGEKMTQEKAASDLGFATQGAFSHYINAILPMSLEAVIKIANYFGCRPHDISPELSKDLPESWPIKDDKMTFRRAEIEDSLKQAKEDYYKPAKIPLIPFTHSEISKLINSPKNHTGEFMSTFVEVGKKSFAVILDDRHRSLDPPGTVIVFDPDAEPTFEKECFILVSFPADPEYYEIMRYIKHEGKPSVENLTGRHQPMSISSTGAIIHARAVKRIGDI